MSERSHFPLAKIKHFTTSCQILIRRKLAEEYHFPKQTGQVFLLFWVACLTLSPSPALISSSVISSCLNANSKGARAVFHSNRSFVIKEGGGKPHTGRPCAPAVAVCCLKQRGWGLRFCLNSRERPQSLPAPARTRWRKSVLNLRARSHQNNIWVSGLQSVLLAEKKGEKTRKKENRQRTEHKEMSRQAAAHTRQLWWRERRGQLGVNINTGSAVTAQQVIMITTCSLGGLSLI